MNLFDSGIRPLVDDYLLKQAEERRNYGDYWSASSAGYCMRKTIFDRLQVPYVTEDPRKQRVFESGHIFHEWLQRLTKEIGVSIAQEVELQDEELMVRGHFDDLVLINGELILYDFKTAHSRSFTYAKDRPMSWYHRLQLATYLYMIRILQNEEVKPSWLDGLPELTESRVLTISKDDLRLDEKQLLWSEALSNEVRDYWTALNEAWYKFTKSGKLPPCTCADHEGGFMAKEQYNQYFYQGEPCSEAWFNKHKEITNERQKVA